MDLPGSWSFRTIADLGSGRTEPLTDAVRGSAHGFGRQRRALMTPPSLAVGSWYTWPRFGVVGLTGVSVYWIGRMTSNGPVPLNTHPYTIERRSTWATGFVWSKTPNCGSAESLLRSM